MIEKNKLTKQCIVSKIKKGSSLKEARAQCGKSMKNNKK